MGDGLLAQMRYGNTYSKKWTSPVESREIAQEILSNLLSMSLYDRLKIGIPKDYQLPKI